MEYVYFVSYSHTDLQSEMETTRVVHGFGRTELSLTGRQIRSMEDIRGMELAIENNPEFKNVIILNFQLLRTEELVQYEGGC